MTPLRDRMLDEMKLRNLSVQTQKCYLRAVANFAEHFGKSPDRLGPAEVRSYFLYLLEQRHVSPNTVSAVFWALRFFSDLQQSFQDCHRQRSRASRHAVPHPGQTWFHGLRGARVILPTGRAR